MGDEVRDAFGRILNMCPAYGLCLRYGRSEERCNIRRDRPCEDFQTYKMWYGEWKKQ